jgi:hypothetical protein
MLTVWYISTHSAAQRDAAAATHYILQLHPPTCYKVGLLVVLFDALHDSLHITCCQGRFLAGLLRYLLVLLLAMDAAAIQMEHQTTQQQQTSGISRYAKEQKERCYCFVRLLSVDEQQHPTQKVSSKQSPPIRHSCC